MEVVDIISIAVAAIFSFIVGVQVHRWRDKPNVVWYGGTVHSFTLTPTPPGPPFFPIQTETLYIHNLGRAPAKKVRAILESKPPYVNVQPRGDYTVSETSDGHHVIAFDALGRDEVVEIQVLYLTQLAPKLIQVRSDEGVAKRIPVGLLPRVPTWLTVSVLIFALIGCALTLAAVIWLGRLAWQNTAAMTG